MIALKRYFQTFRKIDEFTILGYHFFLCLRQLRRKKYVEFCMFAVRPIELGEQKEFDEVMCIYLYCPFNNEEEIKEEIHSHLVDYFDKEYRRNPLWFMTHPEINILKKKYLDYSSKMWYT